MHEMSNHVSVKNKKNIVNSPSAELAQSKGKSEGEVVDNF